MSDYELERNYHPENFEGETLCPECDGEMREENDMAVCTNCGYSVTLY
jgi:Zn finger protein HypA/HybF involved in hydrogenase expression